MLKMGVGPPESVCRDRLQTTACCCVQKVVVSDAGNAVPRGRQVRIEKVSESELPMTHRKERDAVETRSAGCSSDQSEGNLFTAQMAAGV